MNLKQRDTATLSIGQLSSRPTFGDTGGIMSACFSVGFQFFVSISSSLVLINEAEHFCIMPIEANKKNGAD